MHKSDTLLKISDLDCHYGHIHVLQNINIEIKKGEIVALIGANGAGKTTLMKTISGLKIQDRGDIIYKDNIDITKSLPEKRVKLGIAQVPEGRELFKSMSVYDNLMLGSYTRSNKNDIQDDLDFVYEKFPILFEKKEIISGNLSGGQQQMLAIGRALMSKPDLLLMDEPSMGLAPVIVEEIFAFIEELKKIHMTVFLVEQNSYFALSISNHAYVLENGEIVLSGNSEDLIKDKRVKEAYLGM
ncbi:ABC transporter ATP-binding protein [Sulfurospirillum sp. 1612]|uniref:ABC transporter ATP-binding protein n=1 Tax=Sulfurospirillum sp. 1612 TaxID=3094835 RepID=UPI002F947B11